MPEIVTTTGRRMSRALEAAFDALQAAAPGLSRRRGTGVRVGDGCRRTDAGPPDGRDGDGGGLLGSRRDLPLTPLKDRCLAHCRSPLALLFRYASFRGRRRDVRAGVHHAAVCVACCWTLMALLVAFLGR